jgi:hypothetical protein
MKLSQYFGQAIRKTAESIFASWLLFQNEASVIPMHFGARIKLDLPSFFMNFCFLKEMTSSSALVGY